MSIFVSSWFIYICAAALCEESVLDSGVDVPQTPAAAQEPESSRRCIGVPAAAATWSAGQCDSQAVTARLGAVESIRGQAGSFYLRGFPAALGTPLRRQRKSIEVWYLKVSEKSLQQVGGDSGLNPE